MTEPGTPEEPKDESVTDALPDDLDVSAYVGPYLFPNNNRRRVPGYLYLGVAALCMLAWALTRSDDPVLVNQGFLWAGLGLALVGAYHLASGWNLDVDEQDALVIATRTVGFAVGHASAADGLAGRAQPAHLAHPAVLGGEPAAAPRPRAGRRRGRRGRGLVRRGQPRGLVD